MKQQEISGVRSFNRFYTGVTGLLDQHILSSSYSLPEARILYEIYHSEGITASAIIAALGIDKGYLSRILQRFLKDKLLSRKWSATDGRTAHLSLTAKGKKEFQMLDEASHRQVERMLTPLKTNDRLTLIRNMRDIQQVLSPKNKERATRSKVTDHAITIRTRLLPGDIGHVTNRHGEIYSQEYGYSISFEAYVANGLFEFYKSYDPSRDRVWICEDDGHMIGFLLLMHRPNNAAQLRYFFLEPEYRGMGLGKQLMSKYIEFLKKSGYTSSYLWTTHELEAAASLYKRYGFQLVEEKQSTAFGKLLREQRYELVL